MECGFLWGQLLRPQLYSIFKLKQYSIANGKKKKKRQKHGRVFFRQMNCAINLLYQFSREQHLSRVHLIQVCIQNSTPAPLRSVVNAYFHARFLNAGSPGVWISIHHNISHPRIAEVLSKSATISFFYFADCSEYSLFLLGEYLKRSIKANN